MALVRCEKKRCEPEGDKYTYIRANTKKPIGYGENNAVICGRKGCFEPGLVWLNEYETEAYNKGEKIFSTRVTEKAGVDAPPGAKVRVQ